MNNDDDEAINSPVDKMPPGVEGHTCTGILSLVYQPFQATRYKMDLNTGGYQGFSVPSEIRRKELGTMPSS